MSYCGDYKKLPNSYERFGTKRECLQKGIGVGKNMSKAEKKNIIDKYNNFQPSDRIKIYCGDKKTNPIDYIRNGTRHECLKRGIGIGIRLEDDEEDDDEEDEKSKILEIARILMVDTNRKSKIQIINSIIEKINKL